jgi:hypothetical protein
MPVVTMATRGIRDSMKKDMPVQSNVSERKGKVKRSKFRRPHLSIVKRAGMAKRKLRMPVPMDTSSAVLRSKPLSRKMLVL